MSSFDASYILYHFISTTPGIATSIDFAACKSALDGVLLEYADSTHTIDNGMDSFKLGLAPAKESYEFVMSYDFSEDCIWYCL